MAKHTLRPLSVGPKATVWTDRNDMVANCGGTVFSADEEEANAVLFAAAPKMLERLQILRDWIPNWMAEVDSVVADIDAAISAATDN